MTVDFVKEYAEKVLNGDIIAGKKIKLACKKELKDREKSLQNDFNYYFDNQIASKAIKFMELIPNPTGDNMQLALFQKWIIGSLYGWREKKTKNRRYQNAFISMARKNGKSFLASAIGIATLLIESKPSRGRQVLFVANSLSQAMLSFNMARSELNRSCRISPFLRRHIDVHKQEISDTATDSFMKPLPADADHLDGYNPTTAIVDEYHAAKDHSIVNVLKSGQGQQPNALLCIISTSGFNLKGAMFEDYKLMDDILNGKTTNDRQFIAIYEQDFKEDIYKPESWQCSNPLFEVDSVKKNMQSKIQSDVTSALQTDDLNPVLVKNFNRWEKNTNNSYIAHIDWESTICQQPDIRNHKIIFGIDLSKANDLTSVSWIVPLDDGRYYADSHSWVGTKYGLIEKMKADNINYEALQDAGECTITTLNSGVISYSDIFQFIVNMVQKLDLDVQAICYDPWSFGYLLGDFEKQEYPLVEIQQQNRLLNFPTKQFREQVFNKNIIHNNNHLLSIAVDNAVLNYDSTGNCRIDKTRYENKIDPLAALMNAWVYVSNNANKESSEADNEFYTSEEFSF